MMRYIEQIKSFVLAFLVLLSITLTLLIWNYKPEYELIEETKVEEILIGETKELQDVLKPYRALYYEGNQFYGTVSPETINKIYNQLTSMHPRHLKLYNGISDTKINELLRMDNRLTLFFNEEIPLQVFSNIFTINDKDIPDDSFTRLIIDWSDFEAKGQLQLLFLNTEKRVLYQTIADVSNETRFLADVVEPVKNYRPFMEVERGALLSLYLTQDAVESTGYTYLIDNTFPDTFKDLLFSDPNIVQRNVESAQAEKYTDGTSLMTVDTHNRILNYVYPPAESIEPIPSRDLLLDSYDFINDHGGFTSDYRLSSINIGKHIVEYQLFLNGYPIYSNSTSNSTMTRIVTTWGENRIFRYRRPYYTIEQDIIRSVKQLSSGAEVLAYLENSEEYSMKDIDEVVIGYYLMQDQDEEKLFILEPSWFIISNNTWMRISPERIGGTYRGLE